MTHDLSELLQRVDAVKRLLEAIDQYPQAMPGLARCAAKHAQFIADRVELLREEARDIHQ